MCPPTSEQVRPRQAPNSKNESNEPFPWHLGACDAHCHPTDTMASIASIANMRARMLTIMSTRSEDQDLVLSVTAQHGIKSRAEVVEATGQLPCRVVPAYGWHPWFSHQFYDDTAKESTFDRSGEMEAEKTKHYTAVLSSTPDAEFIASLPNPRPLSQFIAETRERLLAAPTALVGEIGLDKAFRLPQGWDTSEPPKRDDGLTPGGREGRKLSPHRVKMSHQESVLKAQLRLAGELGRPVSIHDVGAHGGVLDALSSLWKGFEKPVVSRRQRRMVAEGAEDFSSSDEDLTDDECGQVEKRRKEKPPYEPRPYPPRICLHSYSGSSETLRQYLDPAIPARIYFSFSMAINLSKDGLRSKFADVIGACPDNQLLVETDLHLAGDQMEESLEQIYREVCKVKGWTLIEGLETIRRNYEEFLFGKFD